MQLDEAERGFSFQADGPLDMRMSRRAARRPPTSSTRRDEEDLADILYMLGEERRSRAIARAIVKARAEDGAASRTTRALAELVVRALSAGAAATAAHPATRTFQALRIYVNDELGELAARAAAPPSACLKPGGRLVVVTFHSLEDRIVKRFFAERAAARNRRGSRHLPEQLDKIRGAKFPNC